jgi:hypothetical protein
MALQKKLANSLTTLMLGIIGLLLLIWLVRMILD